MDLVVFSQRRWDFTRQRHPHLLTRLAARHRVVVVEAPSFESGAARLDVTHPASNVCVLHPITPVRASGFHDDQIGSIAGLLEPWLSAHDRTDVVALLDTPMALPLLAGIAPRAVVYDCAEDGSAAGDAPRQWRQREAALLRRADLVITPGPSLHDAMLAANRNVLCLPSGVDADDAERGAGASAPVRHLHAVCSRVATSRPRLGFVGTVDDRIDLTLVAALADANPGWQVVMAGPVTRIDADALPQRPNLAWLGPQSSARAAALVAGFDVCVLPFALNHATCRLNPPQALEAMAAGRPVVCTGVHDVLALHGDVVRIGLDHASFIRACRAVVDETPVQRMVRQQRTAARVARYSWDACAAALHTALLALPLGAPSLQPAEPVLPRYGATPRVA